MRLRSMRLSVILVVSLLVVGALLLAACGKKTATQSTQTSPTYGGTLRIAIIGQGANIGWPATITAGGAFSEAYYETLLRSDNKGNLSGWLAESYEIGKDKKSITFHIRKGIKFSDGSDLTAEVVKWNLAQYPTLPGAAAPAGPPAGGAPAKAPAGGAPAKAPAPGSNIVVVDPYTVRVNFKTWDNTIPAAFGDVQPAFYMVSKAAFDKNGKDWLVTHPVGTGPFTVASYTMDGTAKLVKNKTYWAKDPKTNKPLPYLDELDCTFTAVNSTELLMAKSNQIDMIVNTFSGRQYTDFKNLKWQVHELYDANEVWAPDSAHADSPWSKPEVREAAEYAVDRATIAQKFGYGFIKAPNQIPPRDTTAHDPNFALGRNYDPAKAKQLLAQAGYPNGFNTSLIVWQGGNRDIAQAEQQYLLAVGIKADLQFADLGKWSSYIGPTGQYHNALLEGPDPAQGPTGLGCVSFALFLYGHSIQQPPELLQALGAATLSYPKPETTLIRAATDVLTKNALLIPLYEIGSGRVEAPNVHAEFGKRGLPFYSLETAWLAK